MLGLLSSDLLLLIPRKIRATMSKRQLSGFEEASQVKTKKIENDGKLVICKSPISLKDMTASQICVLLWYHQNIRLADKTDHFLGIICHNSHNEPYTHVSKKGFNYEYYDCDDDLIKKIAASVDELPIPFTTHSIIKSYLKPVDRQLKHWLYYHNKCIFLDRKDASKANDVADEIIWRSNGTIDYLATARNILTSERLSYLEKIRVMFTYCLEDEIKKIADKKPRRKFLHITSFTTHPLLYYWFYSLHNELHEIPIVDDSSCIESYMLTIETVDNWAAIEYFFDKLNYEEQIEKCVFLIRQYGIRYQCELLSKLSDSQQHRVFMDCAKSIIINFGEIASYEKYALEVWIRYGLFISRIEFAEIIEELINFSCQSYAGDNEHIPTLLIDLWKNAPDDYKDFVLNYKEHEIVKVIMFYEHFLNIDRIKLLIELLSNAQPTVLNNIANSKSFFYFCQALLIKFPAYYLKKVIDCCVIERNADFKKKILECEETNKHFISLVQNRNIERLSSLLLVLTPYAERNEFKKRFLSSWSIVNPWNFEISNIRCKELNELIDQIFPQHRDSAADLEK